jgi:threonine dehydratase
VGKEILEEWPEVEAVLVPVGGGGLVSGIAAYVKRRNPDCLVVGVEAANADSMRRSLIEGEPVTIDERPTIADGISTIRPGDLTFAHAQGLVDEIVTVDDDAIAAAAQALLERSKLLVEFSGAATTAAILSGRWKAEGRRTALVLSGGNRSVA